MWNISNDTANGTIPNTTVSPGGLSPAQNGTQFVLPHYATMIFYVVQCIFTVFGLVGNVLVILSVQGNNHMKKSITNLFITNLAIADIGVLAISHTFILGLEIHGFMWPFGEFTCRALYPLSDAFYGVSIWSIVAISYHRYQGIVHIMHTQLSKKNARIILCATWLLSVVFVSIPLWIHMRVVPTGQCDVVWPNRGSSATYNIYLNILFYVLPLTLIVYFYLRIRVSLRQSSGFHRQMTKSSSRSALREDITKRIQRNAKALRVLTPVVVVFFLTMLPFTIFRLFLAFGNLAGFRFTHVLFLGCVIMLLANSSANPVIYTIVSPEFRRSFIRFLGMKKLAREGTSQRRKIWSRQTSGFLSVQKTDDSGF